MTGGESFFEAESSSAAGETIHVCTVCKDLEWCFSYIGDNTLGIRNEGHTVCDHWRFSCGQVYFRVSAFLVSGYLCLCFNGI